MLSKSNASLQDFYDILIVGSGYGGAIAAARLGCANAANGGNLRIAVLERGDEYPTGAFPQRAAEVLEALREPLNPMGLYEYLIHKEVDVLQGCGLGGTSLINANVAIVPDPEVFKLWPSAIQKELAPHSSGNVSGPITEYYGRARAMLGANPYFQNQQLKKDEMFRGLAVSTDGRFQGLDIVVSQKDRITRYGVPRKKCTNCGDCVTGCNVGAKNTLVTNYLPMAKAFGVDLFTRVQVSHIERIGEPQGYRVVCTLRSGPNGLETQRRAITARRVILSAGTLGSTGILLRSREAGLSLSPQLGKHFSGNGDFIAIAYNTSGITDFQGFGADDGPRSQVKAGPTITASVRLGEGEPDLTKRYLVEDLSCPRALVDGLRLGLFLSAPFNGGAFSDRRKFTRWRQDIVWNKTGATNSTLGFLIMGHDNSNGEIVLEHDALFNEERATVRWPGEPREKIYAEINKVLKTASAKINGTYITNPRWRFRVLGRALPTVHPLGGCATADDVSSGVVDHRGRVFDSNGETYDGLYVADGSVVPRALGVNPFLTISMFAERMTDYLRQELSLPAFDRDREMDDN